MSLLDSLTLAYTFRGEGKCVKLGGALCQELNYSMTLMPNTKMQVDTMEEVTRRISEFSPLFKLNCYENLKFFICNMFMPVCQSINAEPVAVYPCQHVCEEARRGCEPLMRQYNFQWPDVLSCSKLKDVQDNPNALCGRPPPRSLTTGRPGTAPVTKAKNIPYWMNTMTHFPKSLAWIKYFNQDKAWQHFATKFGFDTTTLPVDRAQSICSQNPNLFYVKRDNKDYCPQKCDADTVFTATNKKFATVWISIWSVICFLSTLLTVWTFLIDHKRFKYPERPIIFLSFCYNLYSIGYLIRIFSGYEGIVCESSSQGKHVVIEGMSVTLCTFVFFLLYFFGMASALWWVILSLTWFLSAALKWGHEAIEKYSSLFHAVSWAIPTVQTIVALATRKVDADRLSGLCFIGNERSEDLLLFVALPLMIYLLIGTIFLIMGFVALIKIRKVLRKQRNTNKFERLMIRIGLFSVLYSVPASTVVGCFIQEYNRLKMAERKSADLITCITDKNCADSLKPRVELMYLRYFMLLVVGVTSGVWIWTSKTLNAWKRFTKGGKNGRKSEENSHLYPRKIMNIAPNGNRQFVNRCESQDATSHCNVGLPPLLVGGAPSDMSRHQPSLFTSPRYYYPVMNNMGDFVTSQNINPLSNMTIDEGTQCLNSSNGTKSSIHHVTPDDVTSTQSSKPYSGASASERNSHSHSSLTANNRIQCSESGYVTPSTLLG